MIPNAGPADGNTPVVLVGEGFYPNMSVECDFGSGIYTNATYISSNRYVCNSTSSNEIAHRKINFRINSNTLTDGLFDQHFNYYRQPELIYTNPTQIKIYTNDF